MQKFELKDNEKRRKVHLILRTYRLRVSLFMKAINRPWFILTDGLYKWGRPRLTNGSDRLKLDPDLGSETLNHLTRHTLSTVISIPQIGLIHDQLKPSKHITLQAMPMWIGTPPIWHTQPLSTAGLNLDYKCTHLYNHYCYGRHWYGWLLKQTCSLIYWSACWLHHPYLSYGTILWYTELESH